MSPFAAFEILSFLFRRVQSLPRCPRHGRPDGLLLVDLEDANDSAGIFYFERGKKEGREDLFIFSLPSLSLSPSLLLSPSLPLSLSLHLSLLSTSLSLTSASGRASRRPARARCTRREPPRRPPTPSRRSAPGGRRRSRRRARR